MSKDRWKHRTDHVSDPARNFQNVGTSDVNDLAIEPKGLVFGTTGNCVLIGEDGVQATIPVIAGVVYPFMPQRILTAGHTAGTITLLY